jgi:hypothetical protein
LGKPPGHLHITTGLLVRELLLALTVRFSSYLSRSLGLKFTLEN